MIRSILILLVATAAAHAERIIPPSNLFRDPRFVKDFVGSYGFLSDVEPKVSSDEQALLTKVREMFEASRFKEAEQEIVRFIKETEGAHRSGKTTRRNQSGARVCLRKSLLPG